jgi:hypothetical protein
MQRCFAVNLTVALSLAALLAVGCSRSGDSKPAADAAVAGTRSLAAIWADVLTQRDVIHQIFVEDLEAVTHQDCADLGAAARRLDDLYSELATHLSAKSGQADGRLRAIGEIVARASGVVAKIRESALAEAPGVWITLRYPLDQSLRELESYFTADELAQESVMSRPGFEAQPPPAALSPI